MSSMRELKAHLNAVKQTRQITNAMYLLSTSRVKRAIENIDFNLKYMNRLRATIKDILSKTKHNDIHNGFIEKREKGLTLFITVTSDKGLCGSFNSTVAEVAIEKLGEYENPILLSIGSEGSYIFSSRGITPDYTWQDVLRHPTLSMASQIADTIIELYKEHEINEAFVVYTEYVSASLQKAVCRRLLPLLRRDFLDIEYEYKYTAQPIYDPSIKSVFESLVTHYVTGFMYDVFMQSAASENTARMNAMQSATKNADEMISDLSRQVNAVRQLTVTNEITEIAAGTQLSQAKE